MSRQRTGVQSADESIADVNDNWEVGEGGNAKGGRVSKNREASLTAQCLICTGAAAAHQHYGAVCCYSCRAFFRRGIVRNYNCVRGDNLCQVNSITRTNCKRCRYARCLAVGMKPELVDATLKRKQEERRRQELIEIQHEMGIQTVGDMHSQTSQAVTGMMQLQQGGVSGSHAIQLQAQQAQHVMQAVQGLQTPLPRHMVQQEVTSDPPVLDRSDESLLYQLSQALEGRKKVLLELRNGDQEQQKPVNTVDMNPETLDIQQSVPEYPEYVQVEEPPRAHQVNQPLRQQTYYIFHPLTQTFEPITIAEFEENAVIEEVVVAEDYSIAKQDNDENTNPVANEHDYIDIGNENGPQIKRPRLSYEEKPNLDNFVHESEGNYFSQEGPYEEVERKPVIAPVIKSRSASTEINRIKIEKPDSEKANYTSVIKRLTPELIEETVRNHKNKLVVNDTTGGEASHVVGEIVETVGIVTDLGKVIEETIGKDTVINSEKPVVEDTRVLTEVPAEKIDARKIVDIEELVDVCFEEELQKSVIEEDTKASEIIPEAAPVLVVEGKKTPGSNKMIQRSRKMTGSKKRRQSGSLLPLKKRRTHFNQTVALHSHRVPYMGFTVEEELRVSDISAKIGAIAKKFNQTNGTGEEMFETRIDVEKMRKLISSLILDVIEECRQVGRGKGFRMKSNYWAALAVAELLVSLCEDSSSQSILNASQSLAKSMKESCHFAINQNVFKEVVESTRKLLDGDAKLTALFLMATLSQDNLFLHSLERTRPAACVWLLLFRYLNSKMQRGLAAARAHALLGSLDKMQNCLEKVVV